MGPWANEVLIIVLFILAFVAGMMVYHFSQPVEGLIPVEKPSQPSAQVYYDYMDGRGVVVLT